MREQFEYLYCDPGRRFQSDKRTLNHFPPSATNENHPIRTTYIIFVVVGLFTQERYSTFDTIPEMFVMK